MPPGKNESRTWIKTVTALFILKLLKNGPAHGNRLADEIKEMTGNRFAPNPNFLYPLLRDMLECGYVTGNWDNPHTRGKKIYTITEEGRSYFLELQQKVTNKISEMEQKMDIIKKHLCE